MRYLLLLLSLYVVSPATGAVNNAETFKHLCAVNSEWKNQPDVKHIAISQTPANFNEWITTHLLLVEQTLRARNTSAYSATQRQHRLHLLDELHAYALAGVFPVNDYMLYKNPVFIDRKGTHCAVGYLMMQSGHDDLAKAIDANEKFAYVKEIKTSGVTEWANAFGFTVDELAWIQPGYPPQIDAQDMDGGVNGVVNAMAFDPSNSILYAAGNFTATTSGVQANNIAMWVSGFAGWDWANVGSGTDGAVHALLLHNNKLYAGGEFTTAGGVAANHVAVYDIATGQWQSMGSLDSTVRALAVYKNELYAGGLFSGFVSKWNGSSWVDITQGFLYGEGVRALEVWNDYLVIGGNFELATGALRRHVALYDSAMTLMAMGTPTPVNDFEAHNGKLYAACDAVDGTDTCALAMFDEVSSLGWETLISTSSSMLDGFWGNGIYKLLSHNNALYCAGDFNCASGLTYGNHLMSYERLLSGGTYYNQYNPLLTADSSVRTLAVAGNQLYFGGAFKVNAFSDTLNHTGYIDLNPSSNRPLADDNFTIVVSPNPTRDALFIHCGTTAPDGFRYMITDLSGRKIAEQQQASSSAPVSVAHLLPGTYLLQAEVQGKRAVVRFVKE